MLISQLTASDWKQECIEGLANLLNVHYNIDVKKIELVLGGADANALSYKVDSECTSYFVKLKQGSFNAINASIIRLLQESKLEEIIIPHPTRDGKLVQQLEHGALMVYPFINAPNGFTQHLTKKQWWLLGKALRHLHEVSVPPFLYQSLRKETYSNHWREMVKSFYTKMEWDESDDEITTAFKSFFKQHMHSIKRLVDFSEALSKKIQPNFDKYVLCHSDIHAGNVLVLDENSLYIIDWDEPILAPKERDLMFIGGGIGGVWNQPHEIDCFYDGYGENNINKTILSYYRHERIIVDIVEFAQILLPPFQKTACRLESLQHFKAMFEPNNVVEIAMIKN